MTGQDSRPQTGGIAAIVVNYGTADLAIAAVESLLAQDRARPRPGGPPTEVHLVDNASPGGDAERLAEAHAARGWGGRVTLWPETENHGFGRGNNVVLRALAARQTPPDKVFLLNPDARLENDAVAILARALDADPGAAAAGAGLLRPDLSPVGAAFRFPGPASELSRLAGLGLLDRILARRLVPLPAGHPAGPVDWVSGACVMFRFQAIENVDFFHNDFFLYFEEVDLMRQLRDAGWRVLYVPEAQVVHAEGAATGQFAARQGRKRTPWYLYDSWRIYFARALGRWGALGLALLLLPAACLNLLHRGVRGRAPTLPLAFFSDHFHRVIRPLVTGRPPGRPD